MDIEELRRRFEQIKKLPPEKRKEELEKFWFYLDDLEKTGGYYEYTPFSIEEEAAEPAEVPEELPPPPAPATETHVEVGKRELRPAEKAELALLAEKIAKTAALLARATSPIAFALYSREVLMHAERVLSLLGATCKAVIRPAATKETAPKLAKKAAELAKELQAAVRSEDVDRTVRISCDLKLISEALWSLFATSKYAVGTSTL